MTPNIGIINIMPKAHEYVPYLLDRLFGIHDRQLNIKVFIVGDRVAHRRRARSHPRSLTRSIPPIWFGVK